MNSATMNEFAKSLAESADVENANDRVLFAYNSLFARNPSDREVEIGVKYLSGGEDRSERWTRYIHGLLASNEMMFVD